MPNIQNLHRLSYKNHGVFTNKQLLQIGFIRSQTRSLLSSGILIPVQKGIYTLAGSPNTWHQQAILGLLSCGPKAKLSHSSVLQLFDLLPKNRCIHVLSPTNSFKNENIHCHRSIKLDLSDRNNVSFGIKHVSIERALIDTAINISDRKLSYLFDQALTKKLFTITTLNRHLTYLESSPGCEKTRLKSLVDSYSTKLVGVESSFEKRVEDILRKVSRFKLIRQFEVTSPSQKYRLDFAIPELKIAIEADGFVFHKDRATFDYDKKRDSELSILGWNVLHITAKMKDSEIRDLFSRLQLALAS